MHSSQIRSQSCTKQTHAVNTAVKMWPNETNQSCMEFASINFKTVAAIRAASAVVSFVLCLIAIVINVASQKYAFQFHRIVLYFSISGALNGVTKALNRVDYFVENNGTKAFCMASGFMDEYASWANILSAFAIGYSLLAEVLERNNSSTCVNRFWLLLIFVFPLSFNWIPFIHLTYGQSADWAWCTMRIVLEDCSTFTLALVFHTVIWLVPASLVSLAVIVSYTIIVAIVIRRRREWDLTHDYLTSNKKKMMMKEVVSVLFLVLGFVFVNSLSLILRIIQLVGTGKAFPLWIIYAISTPLMPGLVSFILTVDRNTCNTALRSFTSKNAVAEYTIEPALEGSGTIPRTDSEVIKSMVRDEAMLK